MYDARIIADSIANDQRIITIEVTYPRFIHAEFLRHRTLSHSVSSSRAIPTEKMIKQVLENPFVPEIFNKRVKGMGVGEPLEPWQQAESKEQWLAARDYAVEKVEQLMTDYGIDKSRANRLLEPFVWVNDLVTGTDWDNFFALRNHGAAQPEFQKTAQLITEAFEKSNPLELYEGEWHLPLVDLASEFPEAQATQQWETWARISGGRCARESYSRIHHPETADDSYDRAENLIDSRHMSPFEHQATPFTQDELYAIQHLKWQIDNVAYADIISKRAWKRGLEYSGNLRLWKQYRKFLPNEENFANVSKS